MKRTKIYVVYTIDFNDPDNSGVVGVYGNEAIALNIACKTENKDVGIFSRIFKTVIKEK